jgi:hypothetical protein
MYTEPLDAIPQWGLFAIFAALLGLAIEGGYRLGRYRHAPDEKEQSVGAMVASILGLVALVLSFTFSLAASRFDARRQAVLEEANAIGTTFLRARFLPQPQRGDVEELLRQYVDIRLQGVRTRFAENELEQSEAIQNKLWTSASEVVSSQPDSISVGLFVQSLNDVIDLHAKRVMLGLRSRIPLVIWIGVLGLAVIGLASVGYQAGLSATRRSPAMIALVFAFAIVLMLISDLDRAHEGLLRVGQQALVDVRKSMEPITP